jgi:hypothetical protein
LLSFLDSETRITRIGRGRIFGFDGFKVSSHFETASGARIADSNIASVLRGATLVLVATRRWLARRHECSNRVARCISA